MKRYFENFSIAELVDELKRAREELQNLRPKEPPVSRPHQFEKLIGTRPDGEEVWAWHAEFSVVELRKFNAAPGLEAKAYDLGQLIRALKDKLAELTSEKIFAHEGCRKAVRNVE